MDSIMLPADFDVANVHYGVPRTNDNGGKSIYLSFNKKPIVLQTPEMFAPFGKQEWKNDKGVTKYTLDLSFKGMESRDLLKTFFDKMNELDEKLIDDGVANSFDWLKKKGASREVVKALYTRLVRHPIDKNTGEVSTKFPPTFKLTLPWKDGAFQCEVYDADRKITNLANIETKGARVTALIQCLGIWVAAGKYGCTWKVLQMKVVPPQAIKGYAFKDVKDDVVDDDSDDDDEEEKDVDAEEVLHHAPIEAKQTDEDDDSDVVESSDDELEVKKPEPPKAQAVAGKKGTSKAKK
jgi:hypothetical protein